MKNIIVTGCFLLLSFSLFSQERITSNYFFLNPYFYNPAYAGSDGLATLSLGHRQQWRGIDGAPVTSFVSFDIPLNNVVTGIKFINDQKSILNTTTGFVTLGYSIPFNKNKEKESFLTFGLSAGVKKLSVDTDESYDYNDPAVIGLFNSRTHFLGEFGIHYRYRKFDIGFALPALFNPGLSKSELGFKPLDELLFMTSYSFVIARDKVVFEPYLLYRTRRNLPGQFEGTAIVKFYNKVWIGGGYREDYGASALLGLYITENIKFGYGYELASSQVQGFANGSHELFLSISLEEIHKVIRLRPRYKH